MQSTKLSILLLSFLIFKCQAQDGRSIIGNYKMSKIHIQSRWARDVGPKDALKEYPRPLMERKNWQNLNGIWEYAITDSGIIYPNHFDGNILVPYPIESALSGVKKKLLPKDRLWYKKNVQKPIISKNQRILLNFGAVDWKCQIFINKNLVGEHSGGYSNFSYDITDNLQTGNNEIMVKVYDPSDKGPNPHGKQMINPGNIYYTPSSGIWQTVWMETVPQTHIIQLKTTPEIDKDRLNIDINVLGDLTEATMEITAYADGKRVTSIKAPLRNNRYSSSISIPNARLWSPEDPFLYDLNVKIIEGTKTIDEIKSYFGMRKISIEKDEKGSDRIFLNNKYTYNLGVLDQGFWPEGLYTAPTDEALAFDIKAIKAMGFNTIRKHIKIEPERWYYHADKIGMLVWQDFVNPPHALPEESKSIFESEIQEAMDQLHNHPCIITWVLFNERWGAYDQERLTKWVKKYDPSRLVNGHSGELLYVDNNLRAAATNPWSESDMTDVHSYPHPRNAPPQANKARVLGEFGGVGVPVSSHEWNDIQGWGYVQTTPNELKIKYSDMIHELKILEKEGLSASIYTQPFDVEGEENGLLTYDREIIKIPVDTIKKINQELLATTIKFFPYSDFKIAANVDINDNDSRYAELMTEYQKGIRDSALLRRLILISMRKKDFEAVHLIGNDYIDGLIDPFSIENLPFIAKITKGSNDKGFELLRKYPEKVDQILGEGQALSKVKLIIEEEEIEPFIKSKPNWEKIERTLHNKYGEIGEEVAYGRQMLYYGFEADPRNWKKYAKYYVLYFQKALEHPRYHINNMSWNIFKQIDDTAILQFAVKVMKYSLVKWDQNTIEAYDTYANLLYKLKQFNEAIQWEEKAVKLKKGAPDEKVYAETLQKMKAGLPTWPQNN